MKNRFALKLRDFLLLFIILALILISAHPVTAATLDVGGGNNDHSTIQAAVNASNAGDTILVYPGTYIENVDVNKELNITSIGGSDATNVVAVSPNDHTFSVTADNVTISGFNVSGATDRKAGIHLEYHSSDNTLNNNHVWNNQFGIHLDYLSNDNTLNNNHVSNNLYGIYLDGSSNATLNNNHASNNTYQGIDAVHSNYNTLTDNTASDNTWGIVLSSSSNNNTVSSNIASSNTQYGICLQSTCNNNSLVNNMVSDNNFGIFLRISNKTTH
ncbi:MAG: right-handed parallel beta-helix repeat-containing protein [Methanococcoides sp.]|nr:right-handed parallel beta-helix repeat-containing protein [Methanococcoides sp.]